MKIERFEDVVAWQKGLDLKVPLNTIQIMRSHWEEKSGILTFSSKF
jgi:hypothetical protein